MERPLAPIQITQKETCLNHVAKPRAPAEASIGVVCFRVCLVEVFISFLFLFSIWLLQVTVKVTLKIFFL